MKQKKTIRLTENQIGRIVSKAVTRILMENEGYSNNVEPYEAEDAYNIAAQEFGNDGLNAEIVKVMDNEELAKCLSIIFNTKGFSGWREYNGDKEGRNDYETSMM